MPAIAATSFHPVRPLRVHEAICTQVRDRLDSGVLKPGDKLPPEREMAQEFHVSRAGVREALRALENAGVVSLHKGMKGGAFINEPNPVSLARPLQDMVSLGRVSRNSISEARQLANETAVRLACERRTEEDLAALKNQAPQEDTSTFIGLVARATHSPVWTVLVESIDQLFNQKPDRRPTPDGPALQALRDRIVRSIQAQHAASAARAMRDYLALT